MTATDLPDPKRTRGKKRKAGAGSSVVLSAETADLIDKLVDRFSVRFRVTRQQVIEMAVNLLNEEPPS